MKKKFILFLGLGWAGTTSLYYTLKNNNILHGGFLKENFYLNRFFFPNEYKAKNKQHYFSWLLKIHCRELRYSRYSQDNILKNFNKDEVDDFFDLKKKCSLEKYSSHYLKLAEYCKNDYQLVGDFANTNSKLSLYQFQQINYEMSKYFDVKVMIILRDPIRRIWSMTNAQSNYSQSVFSTSFPWYTTISNNVRSIEGFSYTKKIKEVYNVFGKENVHYVIMEDFFKNEKNNPEIRKLENFLDAKISEVYPCAFVPDKGINAPKINNLLKDQWISDCEILTSEFYSEMRNREDYDKIYSEFEELHGFLPADWGSPIDYGY